MHAETAYIALGANLGDRRANIAAAVAALGATPGIRVIRQSSLIENPAVGGPADSPPFLNGVAEIETTLPPHALLNRLLDIERSLGRERRERWEPRAIDLDLILYGNRVIDMPHLKVPHPLMHERPFVLEPLVQMAPDIEHPLLRSSMRTLLERQVAPAPDERGALIREIKEAFAGVQRGEGTTLHEAEEIDCRGTLEDRAAARALDTELCWQDVPSSDLEQYSSIWAFFDPQGFVYYLPAGMIWSLVYGETSDSATPDNILYALSSVERQSDCERLMSRAQLRATARFVIFVLKNYWHEPSDSPTGRALKRWQPLASDDGVERFDPLPSLTTPFRNEL